MAVTHTKFFRGSATTLSSTVYTVPTDMSAIVTNIVISNSSDSSKGATILINDIQLIDGGRVNGNDTIIMDIRQVMEATETIKVFADSTDISFHISGVEIG